MKTLAAILILMLTVSCNSSKDVAKANSDSNLVSPLTGSYTLVDMNGKTMVGNSMELIFNSNDNSIAGSSGCNKLFGSYTQDGDQLKFEGFGTTKMYCDGKMDLEREFIQGLTAVNSLAMADGMIILKNNDSVLMTLKQL